MIFLGKGAQVKAWFGFFGDSANLDAPIGTPSDVFHMESRFVRLETLLVLVQDRCTVYV